MKKLLILMMTVICAVAMLAAGCGGDKKEAKKAEPAKVLRVGTEPTFAPFEFQKEGSKDYDGFDMDLARAIGKQMGAKVEIVNMGFDALIPALNANNIDLIAAGMSITDERKKAITFSEPYYTSGLIIMVNKDNKEVKSEKDLEGNYPETSGSAMVAYALMKGERLGMLEKGYGKIGEEILEGIRRTYLKSEDGVLHLYGICASAGLGPGPDNRRDRDGSPRYYLSEKQGLDNQHGAAACMMAYSEYVRR